MLRVIMQEEIQRLSPPDRAGPESEFRWVRFSVSIRLKMGAQKRVVSFWCPFKPDLAPPPQTTNGMYEIGIYIYIYISHTHLSFVAVYMLPAHNALCLRNKFGLATPEVPLNEQMVGS